MRLFDERGLKTLHDRSIVRRAAQEHADAGEQAVLVWNPDDYGGLMKETIRRAPPVFKNNRPWGKLFDKDETRLRATAWRLGVRAIFIDRQGKHGQHHDLCGNPLQRAMKQCEEESEIEHELTRNQGTY